MNFISSKEPIPFCPPEQRLDQMVEAQKFILEKYMDIQGIPQFPCPLQTRENQDMIKGFLAYFVEELGEAFEHMVAATELLTEPGAEKIGKLRIKHMEINEELADAMHFLLEVMIYANVTPASVQRALLTEFQQRNIGDKYIINQHQQWDVIEASLFFARLFNNEAIGNPPTSVDISPNGTDIPMGAHFFSPKVITNVSILSWEITYTQCLARNLLRNKAWKQTSVEANEEAFQVKLFEVWMQFMRLLDYLGFTSESIHATYIRKNRVNQYRIKSKY